MEQKLAHQSAGSASAGSTSQHMKSTAPAAAGRPRLIRMPEVEAISGLRQSMIYGLMAKGQFPSSIKSGPRTVGWVEAEITAWVAARIAASRGGAA